MALRSTETLRLNLNVLRRHDPTIAKILDGSSFVVLYEHVDEQWSKSGIEGTMFIFERTRTPPYGFFILNRNGTSNFTYDVVDPEDFELADDFIIFRSKSNGKIHGIWIFEASHRPRIAKKLESLARKAKRKIHQQNQASFPPPPPPSQHLPTSSGSKSLEVLLGSLLQQQQPQQPQSNSYNKIVATTTTSSMNTEPPSADQSMDSSMYSNYYNGGNQFSSNSSSVGNTNNVSAVPHQQSSSTTSNSNQNGVGGGGGAGGNSSTGGLTGLALLDSMFKAASLSAASNEGASSPSMRSTTSHQSSHLLQLPTRDSTPARFASHHYNNSNYSQHQHPQQYQYQQTQQQHYNYYPQYNQTYDPHHNAQQQEQPSYSSSVPGSSPSLPTHATTSTSTNNYNKPNKDVTSNNNGNDILALLEQASRKSQKQKQPPSDLNNTTATENKAQYGKQSQPPSTKQPNASTANNRAKTPPSLETVEAASLLETDVVMDVINNSSNKNNKNVSKNSVPDDYDDIIASASPLPPTEPLDRNEFVRQLLTLIHTDRHFIDVLHKKHVESRARGVPRRNGTA